MMETLKLLRNRVKCKFVFDVTHITVDGVLVDDHSSHICCTSLGLWLQTQWFAMADVQSTQEAKAQCCVVTTTMHVLRITFPSEDETKLFNQDFQRKMQAFETISSWQRRSGMDFIDLCRFKKSKKSIQERRKKNLKRPRSPSQGTIITIIIIIN